MNWPVDFIDKIVRGDCLERLKTIPDKSVRLVLTSPPYFQMREYMKTVGKETSGREIGLEKTVRQYFDALLDVFEECVRVIKDDGSIVWNIGDKCIGGETLLLPFRFARLVKKRFGVKLAHNFTWVKHNPQPKPQKHRITVSTEPFLHFSGPEGYVYNPPSLDPKKQKEMLRRGRRYNRKAGEKYRLMIADSSLTDEQKSCANRDLAAIVAEVQEGKLYSYRMKILGHHSLPYGGHQGGRMNQLAKQGYSIIRVPGNLLAKDHIVCNSKPVKHFNVRHIAAFPQEIADFFVERLTLEGEIVLDPFIGSGTTAISCLDKGRRFVGIELSDDYALEAEERIKGWSAKQDKLKRTPRQPNLFESVPAKQLTLDFGE
jgi:DNA modification methylase